MIDEFQTSLSGEVRLPLMADYFNKKWSIKIQDVTVNHIG